MSNDLEITVRFLETKHAGIKCLNVYEIEDQYGEKYIETIDFFQDIDQVLEAAWDITITECEKHLGGLHFIKANFNS